MQLERLSDPTYPMYMRTLTLYKASFPPHEQRQRISQDAVSCVTATIISN